jgi:hypothetical protein
MKGEYPRFNATYTHNELVEHFLLTPAERVLVELTLQHLDRGRRTPSAP